MLSFHLWQILRFEPRCLGEMAIELGWILDHGLRYWSICSTNFFFSHIHLCSPVHKQLPIFCSSLRQRSPPQANIRCNSIHCHSQSQP
ncbi:hypothetical protein Hanom_Chr05g00393521 [Helianthus anomalus]